MIKKFISITVLAGVIFFAIIKYPIIMARVSYFKYVNTVIDISFKLSDIVDEESTRELTKSQKDAVIKLREQELSAAQSVNIKALNKAVPGWGDNFKGFLIRGLELMINGYYTSNDANFAQGEAMIRQYNHWFKQNINDLMHKF